MYLDETILLVLAGESPLKKRLIDSLTLILRQQGELFTSAAALWTIARYFKAHADVPAYREYRREIAPMFTEIMEVKEADQSHALEIQEQYNLELSTALHGAIMRNHDVYRVLSLDEGFDKMKFLERIRPEDLVD